MIHDIPLSVYHFLVLSFTSFVSLNYSSFSSFEVKFAHNLLALSGLPVL